MTRDTPLQSCKMVARTASFSTGFREQVEYTSRPPGCSSSRPRFRIRSCNLDTAGDIDGRLFSPVKKQHRNTTV